MATRSFKDRTMQAAYRTARKVAADNFSEFYYSASPMGPRWPRRGASHRHAYWVGRAGRSSTFVRNSLAHAFWAAGVDDMRDHGAVMLNDLGYGTIRRRL